jgi:hypothetical protein
MPTTYLRVRTVCLLVCDCDIYLYLNIFMGPIYKTAFRGFFSERELVDFLQMLWRLSVKYYIEHGNV